MEPITVVTLADNAYAMPLAVMVRSLLESFDARRDLHIIIIDGGITDENRARLERSWSNTAAWRRTAIQFVKPVYGSENLPVWGRVPLLTYARISIADYLPEACGRAILLDSDLLIVKDIALLAAEDLGGAIVAATRDPFIPLVSSVDGLENYAALGMLPADAYFNAGIMVLDLAAWRREEVAKRAFDFVERHADSLHQYDQDSLNVVLRGRWRELDAAWQVHPRIRNSLGPKFEAAEPRIFHFSGTLKPWIFQGAHHADRLFFEVLDHTEWRGWRPPRTVRAILLRVYDSPLRRLIYPIERRLTCWWRSRARKQRA